MGFTTRRTERSRLEHMIEDLLDEKRKVKDTSEDEKQNSSLLAILLLV
jgi:hypothetical protein